MLIYSATYLQIVQYIGQFILSHIYGYTGKLINSFDSPFFSYLFFSFTKYGHGVYVESFIVVMTCFL